MNPQLPLVIVIVIVSLLFTVKFVYCARQSKLIAVLAAVAVEVSATVAPEATSTAAAAKRPSREIRNMGIVLRKGSTK
jgi:Ca2+/Na+ antiporter